ncbi:TPA: Regulator of telomere elongation helicase 1 [Trebouxia sp. C0004]
MHTYSLRGVEVEFPYDAYACQLDYMERVIQALQEAVPSSSTAPPANVQQPPQSWSDKLKEGYAELKAEGTVGVPTIVYSSRTHSQLAQVMKELRNTSYRGNEVDRFSSSHPDMNGEPLDIEDLVKLGQLSGPCPYLLSKEMASTADIVFMPYNYLIDAKNRMGLGKICWENAILIFDEAHNLEGVCSESASFDMPAGVLASCVQEVQSALEIALVRRENGSAQRGGDIIVAGAADADSKVNYFEMANNLRTLKEVLLKLEADIAALPMGQDGYTAPGKFIFELLAKVNLTEETFGFMLQLLEEAMNLLSDEALAAGRKSGARNTNYRLHVFADSLRVVFNSNQAAAPGLPPAHLGYKVHVHMEKSKSGPAHPTLSYWCFSPGVSMRQLAGMHVRSVLLTSGTLAPLDSFAHELQLPFKISLENPHVIDPSQVWVGVVPVGPKGTALNSSYQNRDSREYKEDLGYAVVNFARMVPDGLLVFFPSYGVLKSCTDFWKNTSVGGAGGSIWERIVKHKLPVVEPRDSADFPTAAQDFRDKLNDPSASGAIFLAVCRGKVSEGLDFSDRAGRAVIITGIPYAMKTDPKVRLKKEVLDESIRGNAKQRALVGATSLNGDQWYVQQASRAVNQAMGRVIRHRRDYGAIIMCDERFQTPGARKQLSSWLRGLVQVYPNFGAVSGSLTKFFRDQASIPRPMEVEAPLEKPVSTAGYGHGSGILGALTSNALASKSLGSNMHRLGSKMSIPSAIDSSGLVDIAATRQRPIKPAALPSAASGFNLLSVLEGKVDADQQQRHKRPHSFAMSGSNGSLHSAGKIKAAAPLQTAAPCTRPNMPKPELPRAFARHSPRGGGMSGGGAGPAMVGPAHLIAKHQERVQADTAARPSSAGDQSKPGVRSALSCTVQPAAPTTLPAKGQPPAGLTSAQPEPSDIHSRLTAESAVSACKPAHARPLPAAEAVSAAAATTTSSKASVQDKRQQTARAYLSKLQEALPAAAYEQVMKCLQQYRKDHDMLKVTDGVMDLLRAPSRRHLLLDFATFLRTQDRDWFLRCVKQIIKEPAADSATEAQHAGCSRSNAAKLNLSKPRQPEGTRLPFQKADMSKKGSAAPQSRPQPGLHANQQFTHASADAYYQASGPALHSRAAQQVMQQRHARLQQAITPSPHTLSDV